MRLRIEKAIYGGAGLARADKTVFVPLTLPGELVEARIINDKRSFANAQLERVVEPAASRIHAACPYFGGCGGCDYQHANYAQQLEMKRSILRETMERSRIADVPEIELVSGPAWGYRNRIRLHVQHGAESSLGYKKRGSHEDLAIDECPIAAPVLVEALKLLNREGRAGLLSWCEEVELFTNHDESEVHASFWPRAGARISTGAWQTVCDEMGAEMPSLRGAGVIQAGNKSPLNWGEQALEYQVGKGSYRVSRGAFFQVNRFLVGTLLQAVVDGRSGGTAWDLYAGVGLFARALAGRFDEVIAVEDAALSSRDLVHNLRGSVGRGVKTSALDFLRRQKAAPDLIVVDPPRAGLGPGLTGVLGSLAASEMVYVSCDPATLSRDLHALLQSGYQLQSLTLVDLFPQTYHMESIAVLAR